MERLAIKVLQRRMVVFSMLALLLTGAAVAAVAITPLADLLREAAKQELVHVHSLTAQRLSQHARTLEGIALQVTSRTRIREELEAYLAGDTSAEALRAFTEPKLQDAVTLNRLMTGITRRGPDGREVAAVGTPPPAGMTVPPAADEPFLIGPVMDDGQARVVAVAPLRDAADRIIGSDVVIFSADGLSPILLHRGGHTAYLAAQTTDDNALWLGGTPDGRLMPSPAPVRLVAAKDQSVTMPTDLDGQAWVSVSSREASTGWHLVTLAPADDVFAEVQSVILVAALATALAVITGAVALLLLLRPLSGTLLVTTDDMAGQVERLRAMGRDLEEERRRLAASNQDLEQFAYAASHDLQQPLRMISGFLDLLRRRYEPQLDDQAREYIDHAVTGARQLRAMIQALLEYSRVGRVEETHTPTDLTATAHRATSLLAVRIAETGAEITVGTLPTLAVEPQQMVRLFQNLIDNALKYRHPDRTPRVTISDGHREKGCGWCIDVTDNGIGMSPEQQREAFGLFRRLHPGIDVEGTGMGLALCQKIAQRHGGTITLRSKEGEGTTFTICLPADGDLPQGGGSRVVQDIHPVAGVS